MADAEELLAVTEPWSPAASHLRPLTPARPATEQTGSTPHVPLSNESAKRDTTITPTTAPAAEWRLRKHADYQRVYKAGRKQSSPSMSYFFALRPSALTGGVVLAEGGAPLLPGRRPVPIQGPRVGLTVGKVLGNAVVRNRIKRRMREAVRKHVQTIRSDVDVLLHPRALVATVEFAKLEAEVGRIFATVQSTLDGRRAKG